MWCFSTLTLSVAAALLSTVAATNFQVDVGKDGNLTFVPETIVAQVGDTVTYNFHPKNHSVTQSSFQEPCQPLAGGGFFSGFVPTADATSRTTWTININDTKPIWIYCSQTNGNHCQKGMVHAINAPTTGNTIDAYKQAAAATTISASPPDGLPVGGLRKLSVDVAPGGNLTFFPSNITELPRTVVEFSFNPANHSVVQSSFADPCHPLAGGGFSSGFIPTKVSPSGAIFQITINDTKPVWFYCAQTTKTHCQAGMVGSINAPTTGNTLEAFIGLAAKASLSTIPPNAPLGGILTVNGTTVTTIGGAVFDPNSISSPASPPVATTTAISNVPPPGTSIPTDVSSMAGGAPPGSYGWAPTISDNATSLLQLINFLDNALLEVLVNGYNNLTTGPWANMYPATITNTIGSMTAQAMVHRSTATDSLQHYSKPVIGLCSYDFHVQNIDDFVAVALTLILLEIGLFLDVAGLIVASDPWLIAPLASNLGSKARMSGMVNMMQNHIPAASPREVMIPATLVYSYVTNHYVIPNSCPDQLAYSDLPSFTLQGDATAGGRVASVTLTFDFSKYAQDLFVAWIGPWGDLLFTSITVDPSKQSGTASVPQQLSGHAWGVITTASSGSINDVTGIAISGPEILWVTQP